IAEPLCDGAWRRIDAAGALRSVEIPHLTETALSGDVPNRSAGNDLARIRTHPRLRHPEGQEDLFAHPLREWATGDSLHHHARQAERRVVVVELRARLVLQRRLPVDHLDGFVRS